MPCALATSHEAHFPWEPNGKVTGCLPFRTEYGIQKVLVGSRTATEVCMDCQPATEPPQKPQDPFSTCLGCETEV